MNQWNNKSMKPLMKLSTMQRPRIKYQEFLRKEIHKFIHYSIAAKKDQ